MVAFEGPRYNPDDAQSSSGSLSFLAKVQTSFRYLVHSLEHENNVAEAASHFTTIISSALELKQVPPELLIESMKLRNPESGNNLFVELGLFPRLASSVCCSISESLESGKPVSSEALRGLCNFASNPQMSGISGALFSYRTLVRGLTNFYQVIKEDAVGEQIPITPTIVMADLYTNLHRTAQHSPHLVGEVMEAFGAIPLSPKLLADLDSILWNSAHPSRTTVPPEVRAAAIRAIADRTLRPPIQISCDESFGIIDRLKTFELFVSVVRQCPDPEVVATVLDRLPEILQTEADAMMTSWEAIDRSSFRDRRVPPCVSNEAHNLLPTVEGLIERGTCSRGLIRELGHLIEEGDRIDSALTVHKVAALVGRITPRTWNPIIQGVLHRCLRAVDRAFYGSLKQERLDDSSTAAGC